MAINDDKWKILFERHRIVENVERDGHFDITATQIKTVREPRLMCKMDFRQSVAKPFRDNGLSILAINNGLYRIAATEPFFDIDLDAIADAGIVNFQLPAHIETLHFENITGESQALDAAVISGMLAVLLGEECDLTIRGRRYSSTMSIELGAVTYPIASVQIEVDGGYEGETKLVLIEAKMGATDNMNMRQLIYPHVHFSNQVAKSVESYLMFYETGSLFTFIQMQVEDDRPILDYANAKRFRLVQTAPPEVDPKVHEMVMPDPGHGAPFPQADDFSKVLFGLLKLSEIEPASKEELFGNFPIHPRQYDYYFNALRWLGLAEQDGRGGDCILTCEGEYLVGLNERNRILAIRHIMLSDAVFAVANRDPHEMPTEVQLSERKMSLDTYRNRRIKTVLSWLRLTNIEQNRFL